MGEVPFSPETFERILAGIDIVMDSGNVEATHYLDALRKHDAAQRETIATQAASIEEQQRTLAAERGLAEGAPSDGWTYAITLDPYDGLDRPTWTHTSGASLYRDLEGMGWRIVRRAHAPPHTPRVTGPIHRWARTAMKAIDRAIAQAHDGTGY
jgi:hypothetical protein